MVGFASAALVAMWLTPASPGPTIEAPAVEVVEGIGDLAAAFPDVYLAIPDPPPAETWTSRIRRWLHLDPPGPPRPAPIDVEAADAPPRQPAITSLYVAFASLQVLDMHSTSQALDLGVAHEANPIANAVVGNKALFLLTKTASTAVLLWASEKLRQRNSRAAVVVMAAMTGVMTLVDVHNYTTGPR